MCAEGERERWEKQFLLSEMEMCFSLVFFFFSSSVKVEEKKLILFLCGMKLELVDYLRFNAVNADADL